MPVERTDKETLFGEITKHVELGATVYTDEHRTYQGLGALYQHETVNHGMVEYARDGVSTNSIEAVWAVLKRGIYGTFHHVSEKHLGR